MKISDKLKPIINSTETENMVTHLANNPELVRSQWENNPLLKSWQQSEHTAGQDIIADLEELSSQILTVKRSANIGQMLTRRFNSTRDNLKIRAPKKGKGSKTARAKPTTQSYGQRQGFITIEADQEKESSEEWDLFYTENAEWNVMQGQLQEITASHNEDISQYMVDQLAGIKTSDSAGLTSLGDSDSLTPDNLIDAWGKVLAVNGDANTLVMNPARAVDLFKNSDMKNQLVLGQFADYSQGMLGMFLGMQIYMSTQVPVREIYAFDKARVLWTLFVRDRLITPHTPRPNVTQIMISSRFGHTIADPQVFAPIRKA